MAWGNDEAHQDDLVAVDDEPGLCEESGEALREFGTALLPVRQVLGRLQYPPNVRVLKFPCTGRIDPVFILRAFQKGADGVLVSGCHPGDCHYMAGNYHARRRFAAFRKLLEFVGVDLERLQFSWVSAAEGGKWVEMVTGLTERVRGMGPLTEFRELELKEQWSGKLDTPELNQAYDSI